ncbi:hypothetical protein HYDPIDRAFT_90107, partial [Hydnomerulius pinastri MD-312]
LSGGGIGGLTLAAVLGKYTSCSIALYEAAPEIATVGAGVTLFTRGMEIMKELGLYEELIEHAIIPPQANGGPYFRKSDQPEGVAWFQRVLLSEVSELHRQDLVNVLLKHIPSTCKLQTSKRLHSYSQCHGPTGPVTLEFSDGSQADCDVLIGADGIRSATRRCMFQDQHQGLYGSTCIQEPANPFWTGILVYRALVPMDKVIHRHPSMTGSRMLTYSCGKNQVYYCAHSPLTIVELSLCQQHVVTYPVSQGRFINVVIHCHAPNSYGAKFEGPWMTEVDAQEVIERFQDWEPEIQTLVNALEKPSRWALHVIKPLPFCVSGRIAILGDAVHAMEPHLGAGAGQAIEDAFILGRLLAHDLTREDNIPDALNVYQNIRLPVASDVLTRSQNVGRLMAFKSPLHLNSQDALPHESSEELECIKSAIEKEWDCQHGGGALLDWGRADRSWILHCEREARAVPALQS